ncbi:hypothetical protein TSUD_297190 [Trifolium subterraneum]|uniref:Reverse transcriptase domain-containing protein n=1 Tax=Trifolium subterraneum TaxID=3900 RepID=A0A2Z6NFT8_TRISU|nr:hypothetical protein TSUD_297190 [Trifolium subterraneum]
MLKCWKDIPGYNLFVKDKWNSFQNLPSRIESLKGRLSNLDQKGEEEQLSQAELVELYGVTSDIHSLSHMHTSICWQQSRSRWLKEGLQIPSTFTRLWSHILRPTLRLYNEDRFGVDNLVFKRLSPLESSLTIPLSVAEVKAVVWDCDSYKSPGPDRINFGFIKDFWDVLQGDVMRFILEFHRNGKLTKGLNSTFIALIPKIDSPQRMNNFRPISLAGCLYKILAKVLANRLRLVIGSVVSKSHIAFVKDIKILD